MSQFNLPWNKKYTAANASRLAVIVIHWIYYIANNLHCASAHSHNTHTDMRTLSTLSPRIGFSSRRIRIRAKHHTCIRQRVKMEKCIMFDTQFKLNTCAHHHMLYTHTLAVSHTRTHAHTHCTHPFSPVYQHRAVLVSFYVDVVVLVFLISFAFHVRLCFSVLFEAAVLSWRLYTISIQCVLSNNKYLL